MPSFLRPLLTWLVAVSGISSALSIEIGQAERFAPGIHGAVELVFLTTVGKYYQVEVSPDMATWDTEGYSVKGTGGEISVMARTRNLGSAYFRVRDDGDPANAAPTGLPVTTVDAADFGIGQHLLPLTGSKSWHLGRGQYDRPALTVLVYGDSLSYPFGNLATTDLVAGLPFMGYKLMADDMYSLISGTVSVPTAGADWLTNRYRLQGPSSVTEWARGNHRSNRISVAYLKGTGDATFSLRYSQNGGSTWTTAATIDTSAAANSFNFAIYSLPTSLPTKVRVETAGGHSVKLIGCGSWTGEEGPYNGEGGYTVVCGTRAGLDMEEAVSTASAATWATIMSAAKVNAVVSSWNDEGVHWDAGGSIETLRARANAGRVADWVMVSGVGGGTVAGSMGDIMNGQRTAQREWAVREGQNFIDWAGVQRNSFEHAVGLGWHAAGDTIHPTVAGYLARQHFVAEALGQVLNTSAGFVGNNRADLGFGFQLRATPWGVRLESVGENSGGLSLTGPGSFLALDARTTPASPAQAGSIVTYAQNNGGVMEYRMMPPNGVPIVLGAEGQTRLSGVATLDYGSIAASGEATLTITVNGVTATKAPSVELGWSGPLENGIVVKQAWVSGANTVSVRLRNVSAKAINPAPVTCRATVSSF